MLVSVSRPCYPCGMGKKRGLLLAILFVALAGGLAWLVLRPREPLYQGKPLSACLDQCVASGLVNSLSPSCLEAKDAIRQIGTNGLPLLLRLISTRDSPLTKQLMAHLPKPWLMRLQLQRRAWHAHLLGGAGFFILGPVAKPAVPALVELVIDPDPDVRATAVSALVPFGPEAHAAVPALLKCLNDPRRAVRIEAMICLGNIHAQPELVVPVLMDYLEGQAPATPIRISAVRTIGNFGAQAKPAVPTLLRLLNDEDPLIRSLVTNCLPNIDPAAAAKAGVK